MSTRPGYTHNLIINPHNAKNRRSDDPNGGSCVLCAPRDLNPEPTVSESRLSNPTSEGADVVRLHPRPGAGSASGGDAEVLTFPAPADDVEAGAR